MEERSRFPVAVQINVVDVGPRGIVLHHEEQKAAVGGPTHILGVDLGNLELLLVTGTTRRLDPQSLRGRSPYGRDCNLLRVWRKRIENVGCVNECAARHSV